jgi:peptide-methionine (R)-S-oxide reductase
MTKKINPNLTAEQKLVLFEDGTEPPNTSELNHEKREGSFPLCKLRRKII